MDYKVILNLMKEMNHTDLTKLEIEEEGFKITLEKTAPTINMSQPLQQPTLASNCVPVASVPTQTIHQEIKVPNSHTDVITMESVDKATNEENGKKLVSPMVGTFYLASGPDKAPFVKVGDKVKKGQTVCIIEAMKLMNEIESELDGEIVKVLVNNEQMVEYGQPLFLVK